jgi:hypothetical protein
MSADSWIVEKPRVRSLRHDIAEALREAIREHHLAPGARILETDLARRFDVSRQPVREAIRLLERDLRRSCSSTFATQQRASVGCAPSSSRPRANRIGQNGAAERAQHVLRSCSPSSEERRRSHDIESAVYDS